MDQKELNLISCLDELLKFESNKTFIEEGIAIANKKLDGENLKSVTVTIPISKFGEKLPKGFGLCRIFILKANTEAKVERHTNSIQRVMSYKGSGTIKVQRSNKWISNPLSSNKNNPVENRWLTVEENIWHQPISGPENWITVTFHTADEKTIIDEYQS